MMKTNVGLGQHQTVRVSCREMKGLKDVAFTVRCVVVHSVCEESCAVDMWLIIKVLYKCLMVETNEPN